MKTAPSIVAWDTLPLTVSLDRVMALTGFSARAIERLVRLRRFVPPIFTRPMRWSRADLQRHWEAGTIVSAHPKRRTPWAS